MTSTGKGSSRRDFLARLAEAAAGGAVLGPLGALGCGVPNYSARMAAHQTEKFDVRDLTQDGKALVTPFIGTKRDSIMVVREAPGQFVALSMTCTHAGCRVNPPVAGIINCPCHGSQYDLTGRVVRGPAPLPLTQYPVLSYDERSKRVTIQIK